MSEGDKHVQCNPPMKTYREVDELLFVCGVLGLSCTSRGQHVAVDTVHETKSACDTVIASRTQAFTYSRSIFSNSASLPAAAAVAPSLSYHTKRPSVFVLILHMCRTTNDYSRYEYNIPAARTQRRLVKLLKVDNALLKFPACGLGKLRLVRDMAPILAHTREVGGVEDFFEENVPDGACAADD